MYSILGGDGKEYGPASVGQIRQWIAAGRANLDTQAKTEGGDAWQRLGDLPEFGGTRPAIEPPPKGAPAAARTRAKLDPLDCFGRSWDLLVGNFWPTVGVTVLLSFLFFGVMLATFLVFPIPLPSSTFSLASFARAYSFSPFYWGSILANLLLIQPFVAGYCYYLLKRARSQPASVADLFSGFRRAYPALVASSLLVGLLRAAGMYCLIVPGIYLLVAYSLVPVVIVDQRVGFWTGMEISRRAVMGNWWRLLLLLVICGIVGCIGCFALLIGLLVAIPVVMGALVIAYQDLIG